MFEPSELLLRNLPEIERIITSICRRKGMDSDATEEFAAEVKLRLVEDDYAIIRAFQNRSSFNAYIAAVIRRLLLDQRNREWGKWRTSAEALRLGELCVALERALYRDGHSIDEAETLLAPKFPGITVAQLEELVIRLPVRMPRRKVDLQEAESLPAPEQEIDPVHRDTARRLSRAVACFIDRLPEEDQLLLHLRFHVALTVAEIARALQVEQPPLYPRLYKLFALLRAELEKGGFRANDVEELIGADPTLLDFRLKTRGPRPSEEDEPTEAARQEEIS